jgi:hypothetical protein
MFLGFVSLLGPIGLYYTLLCLMMAFILSARGMKSAQRDKARIGLICCYISVAIWVVGIAALIAMPGILKLLSF